MTQRSRILVAGFSGLAPVALLAWREIRRLSSLVATLGWPPEKLHELFREAREAWLVICGAALLTSFSVVLLVAWARGPMSTVVAAIVVIPLILFGGLPIYWLKYRGVPAGVHIYIPPSRANAASLAALVSLVLYCLLGAISRRWKRVSVHAAA